MMHVPPVLRDVDFVGVDDDYEGHVALVFRSRDISIRGDGYVRVTILVKGPPIFVYTRFDPELGTICHYKGPHGDPNLDEVRAVKSYKKH